MSIVQNANANERAAERCQRSTHRVQAVQSAAGQHAERGRKVTPHESQHTFS